jgi:hypothetical protein
MSDVLTEDADLLEGVSVSLYIVTLFCGVNYQEAEF